MTSEITQICVDPSCFLSLKKQTDFLKALDEVAMKNPNNIEVVMPTILYNAIIMEPNKKFNELQTILKDWEDSDDKYRINILERAAFVRNTRNFLERYNPKPASEFIHDLEKVGLESIYKRDIIKKLGQRTGNMIFDLMALPWKVGSKIVSLSKKTMSLMAKTGVVIKEGYSKYKKKIRSDAKISGMLRFFQFVMATEAAHEFFKTFQMDPIPLTPGELALGVLLVADG